MSTPFHVLDAFEIVYVYCQQDLIPKYGDTSSHKDLMQKYDLTSGGVETLAYLLHFRPKEIPNSKLRVFPNNRNESSVTVFKDLKNRGFIEERREKGMLEKYYSVAPKAFSAFQKNERFGASFFKDCVQELSECALKNVYSPIWLDKFRYSLEQPVNQFFYEACITLRVFTLEPTLQSAFWAVTRHFLRHFADPFTTKDNERKNGKRSSIVLHANDDDSDNFPRDIYEDISKLAKFGLVDVTTVENDSIINTEYALSANAAEILFHGRDELIKYNELAKFASIVKCEDIKKKELFFSENAQEQIDHLRTILSEDGFNRAVGILKAKNRAPSIQSLLWGPPGTGKTESVLQLARESGRDVIRFDAAKVTGSGWGISEKSYRALFRAYKYVAVIASRTPILLLNEADATLSKRLKAERSIDKAENAVTNILLEEMENMTGILLATTNLIEHLDDAFDRRFLFKTELVKPNAEARAKIWKNSIPQLTDTEAVYLAGKFEMSGGQINNVVTKRDLAELYYSGDRGIQFIEGLCEKELSSEQRIGTRRTRIGF